VTVFSFVNTEYCRKKWLCLCIELISEFRSTSWAVWGNV